MSTLVIKNVDLDELEKQRKDVNAMIDCMPILTTRKSLMSIVTMLDEWSDERYRKSLGSIENQKAKGRQQSLPFEVKVYQCPVCGWQGADGMCDSCAVHMEPMEDVK